MNNLSYAALAMLLLLAPGCDDGTTTDPALGHGLLSSQMVGVAAETDDIVDEIFDAVLRGLEWPGTADSTFKYTVRCPAAGLMVVEGTIHFTFDAAAQELEATLTGSRERFDCAFFRDGLGITVNGTAQFDAYRHKINQRPDGPQNTSYSGSFTAARGDGEERSCEFSVEVVRDPTAHSRSIDAWVCGDHYTRTTSWPPGGGE